MDIYIKSLNSCGINGWDVDVYLVPILLWTGRIYNDVDFIPYLNEIFTFGFRYCGHIPNLNNIFWRNRCMQFFHSFFGKEEEKEVAVMGMQDMVTLKKYLFVCNSIVRFSWLINGANKGVCYICGSTHFRE